MRIPIGIRIGTGYLIALVLLGAVGGVAYHNVVKGIANSLITDQENTTIIEIGHVALRISEAEAGVRGYLLTGDNSYLDHYSNLVMNIEKDMADITNQEVDVDILTSLKKMGELVRARSAMLTTEVASRSAGMTNAAMDDLKNGKSEALADDLRGVIADITREENNRLTAHAKEEAAGNTLTMATIRYGVLAAIVLMLVTGVAITLSITRPMRGVIGVANTLSAAASEISATVSQLAASTTQTASSVTETTTTSEEVKKTAEVALEKSKLVASGARETVRISQSGEEAVRASADSMTRIREQVESVAASMTRLSEQSQAIGMIIASVDDIAEQSNLLAVNAAIEAAEASSQISVSIQQQFAGVDQVTVAMESIKQASEQNVEGTRQLDETAKNLNVMGKELRDLVQQHLS
jgi:methyl-accepting chemotaxis protein